MDQSVTIDGQRVLLNGEPVAGALGDFSVRVLAEAIALHAKMVTEANDDNSPDGYWCQCRLVEAQKSVSAGRPAWWPERFGLAPPENKNHRCSTLTGRIYANPWGGYQPTGPDLGGNPPSQDDYTPRPTPAPADLIIKAREYYPGNEGLLRMYADCRGYSCDQVAEAIDHAKRL